MNVQAGRSRVKRLARFVNRKTRQLNFYSAAGFLPPNTLDSFPARAQHRLYTNKCPAARDAI
jgi:hypothetical protein